MAATRGGLLGGLAALGALLLAAPAPSAALSVLRAPSTAADPAAPLLAVVALAAWGCAGYLLLVAVLTVGTRLPGRLGRLLARLVRLAAPVALRRTLEVGLGLGLAVGAAAAPPALALERPSPAVPSLELPVSPAPVPDLDWPLQAPADEPGHRTADGLVHRPANGLAHRDRKSVV